MTIFIFIFFLFLIYLAELDRKYSYLWNVSDFYSLYVGCGLLGVYNSIIRYATNFDKRLYNKSIILNTHSVFKNNYILKNNYKMIKNDALNMYNNYDLPTMKDIDPFFTNISLENKWKTFVLKWYDKPLETNCKKICSYTCDLIEKIPEIRSAMFSILMPHTRIPSHRGPFTGCLRYHLGLSVPKDTQNCFIRVKNQVYHWQEGEDVIFDDTYEHEVYNNTDEIRIVLFIDIVRPLNGIIGYINDQVTNNTQFADFTKNMNDKGEKLVQIKK
jgi:beta-hydroxylase